MALSRFVVTVRVTVTPDTLAALVAGDPGTGAQAGYGNVGTVSPGTSGKYGWRPRCSCPARWSGPTAQRAAPARS